MQPRIHLLSNNQSGSALVLVLLVLAVITILGVMGINASAVEQNIARNEREVRESFYLAESAAMVGTQRLAAASPADLERQSLAWHQSRLAVRARNIDFRNADHWQTDDPGNGSVLQSPLDPDSYVTAVEWKVAPGSSLIQTESRLYQNRIYGLCTKNGTDNLIEIGYHMRY